MWGAGLDDDQFELPDLPWDEVSEEQEQVRSHPVSARGGARGHEAVARGPAPQMGAAAAAEMGMGAMSPLADDELVRTDVGAAAQLCGATTHACVDPP
eukprot:COSAG02_NODE_10699_length_1881_cov_1.117845_4_plen_98_part_00